MLMRIRYGLDYGDVGMNFVNSGDQGGSFMAPWKAWETSLICWFGHLGDSFGSSSGCLCVFVSRVFYAAWSNNFPQLERYILNLFL